MASPLISTADLAGILDHPNVRAIDASWHLDGRDARVDFERAHIPGAVFFDLDAISDPDSPLPHMLPSPGDFARDLGLLGIGDSHDIVVYDTVGLRSSPRAWWMLKTMGASRVRVLDGGLPKWLAEGREVQAGAVVASPAGFRPQLGPSAVVSLETLRAAVDSGHQIADARPSARFRAEVPEPREGLRGGHMPGARSLPFPTLLSDEGVMKRGAALRQAFVDAGIDPDIPVITTCGSGVTAAILTLGLAELGVEPGPRSRLYDGSWAEWGGRDDTAIITGTSTGTG